MSPKLRDLPPQTDARETRRQASPQTRAGTPFVLDGVAKDLADLLLGAAAMPPRTPLEFCFHVIVELANHELGHTRE